MTKLDDLTFGKKRSYKKTSNAFFLISMILFTSSLTMLLLYDIKTKEIKINNFSAIPVKKNAIAELLEETSPIMAFSSNRMEDVNIHDYYITNSIDGTIYESGDDFNEWKGLGSFHPNKWIGNDEDTEWTVEYDLGASRQVSRIEFQIGDLYTPTSQSYGLKHYKYDFWVEEVDGTGSRNWEQLETGVTNPVNPNTFLSDLTTSVDTGTSLTDPRGVVYDEEKNDFAVADGSGHKVQIFNADGSHSYDITSTQWSSLNVIDVAVIPEHKYIFGNAWTTDFKGGYVIATSDGKIWLSEYGDFILDLGNRWDGSSFNNIRQIATSFETDYTQEGSDPFHFYLLDDDGLYCFEISGNPESTNPTPTSHLNKITPFSMGSLTAWNGSVAVVNEDNDDIYIYNKDLTSEVGTIPNGASHSIDDPADIVAMWGNLLVVDSNDFEVINIHIEDAIELVGTYPIPYNGANIGSIGGKVNWNGKSKILIASSSSGYDGKLLTATDDVIYDFSYFDWDEYEMINYGINTISAYRIKFYDMSFTQNPLSRRLVTPEATDPFGIEGWRRPCIVESWYDFLYTEDPFGISVEIVEPEDGGNFIGVGLDGDFDIDLSVGYIYSFSHSLVGVPGKDPATEPDNIDYKIDNGSWNDITNHRQRSYVTLWTNHIGDEEEWDVIFPDDQIYYFTEDLGDDTDDGDVWNVYLDDVKIHVIDEKTIDGTIGESQSPIDENFANDDLFAEYITKGIHTIRVELVSGSAKTVPSMRGWFWNYKTDAIGASEGYRDLTVSGSDTRGASDQDEASFQIITYPKITIISPEQDYGYNSNVSLIVESEDNNPDSLWWKLNGVQKDIVELNENYSETIIHYETNISTDEMIPNDFNQIEVVSNDTEDHASFGFRTFFLDFKDPVIEFIGTANNSFLPQDDTYDINITDPTLTNAYYVINEKGIKFDLEEGLNVMEIPSYEFDDGLNNLTVFAEDVVGNTATAYLNLSKDTSPPVINITSPFDNERFWEDATPDPIPLTANITDFVINRSADALLDISQSQIDDYLRLHHNSYTHFVQDVVPTVSCITDFGINARGFGRLKMGIYEDEFLLDDPLAVGYADIDDESIFKWYTMDISDTKINPHQTYHLKVETITPFNDIFVSIGNNPYPDGMIKLLGIPRPQWDVAFKWHHKEIVSSTKKVNVSFTVGSQTPIPPSETNYLNVSDLKSYFLFDHGYQDVKVTATDSAGNVDLESVRIQYIDTSITSDIDIEFTSFLENEWVHKNITVTWDHNIPDYVDRNTRENYTYDIYLKDAQDAKYLIAENIVDVSEVEINTSVVSDGFYYIVLNGTDGTTTDEEESVLLRILNGEPTISITNPEEGVFLTDEETVNLTVICPDITNIFYSIDSGINVDIGEPYDFNFFDGWFFSFELNSTQIDDGIRLIETKVTDSDGQFAEDSVIITVDSETYVEINRLNTQAENGLLLITYDVPFDVVLVSLELKNETDVIDVIIFEGNNITGQYLIEDGLSKGTYQVTIFVEDEAGNTATDSTSFLVSQSTFADIIDSVYDLFAMILGLFTGIFAIFGLVLAVKTHQKNDKQEKRRRDLCDLFGGDFCDS